MALNIQALANYLAKNPKSLQSALGVTQFAGQKLQGPQQILKFLQQHPNAANRMGKHLQRAVPGKDLGFGVDVSENKSTQNPNRVFGDQGQQGSAQTNTGEGSRANELYTGGDIEDIRGKGQRTGISNALVTEGLKSDLNVKEQSKQIGPYGGSMTTTKDEQGNVIVTTELSPEQKGLLAAENYISGMGLGIGSSILRNKAAEFEAGFNPNLTARTTTGDINQDRARIEEEVFKRYTKDLDQNYDRDKQRMEAELLSRGVPLTPESTQYQRAMEELNKRYDNQRIEARQRAVEKGGEEFSRSFGIGEQLRGNELSEQSAIRSQQIGEIGAFAGMGPGIRQDQFTPFTPNKVELPDPTAIQVAKTGLKQGQQGLDISKQNADTAAKTNAEQLALEREKLNILKDQQAQANENSWIEGARAADVGVPGPGNTGITQRGRMIDDGTDPTAGIPNMPSQQRQPRTLSMQGEEQAFDQPLPQSVQPAQPVQTQPAPAAPATQPAAAAPWQLGGDRKTLLEQQARIQQRIAEGREVDPAEAQRRLKLVNQALAKRK